MVKDRIIPTTDSKLITYNAGLRPLFSPIKLNRIIALNTAVIDKILKNISKITHDSSQTLESIYNTISNYQRIRDDK